MIKDTLAIVGAMTLGGIFGVVFVGLFASGIRAIRSFWADALRGYKRGRGE